MTLDSDRLRDLLEKAQVEMDSARLLKLLGEINRILEERERQRRQDGDRKVGPGERRAMGTERQRKLADAG